MDRNAAFKVLRLVGIIAGMFSSSTFLVIYNKWMLTLCEAPAPNSTRNAPLLAAGAEHGGEFASSEERTCRGFGFPYPVFLTATHMLLIWIVCCILIHVLRVVPKPTVSAKVYTKFVLPFAVLVALDIALSNSAFLHLEASYVEMLKSGTPAAVLLLSVITGLDRLQVWNATVIALISGGLAIASRGEAHFSLTGLVLVLFAVSSGAVRMILSQILLQRNLTGASAVASSAAPPPSSRAAAVGSESGAADHVSSHDTEPDLLAQRKQLSSIQVLYYQTPVSFLVLLPMTYAFFADVHSGAFAPSSAFVIDLTLLVLLGASMAFVLDIFNLLMIKYSSALSSSVAGCFKTTIVILASWLFFRNPLTVMNLFGYLICILGVVGYNVVKYQQFVAQESLESARKFTANENDDDESVALAETDEDSSRQSIEQPSRNPRGPSSPKMKDASNFVMLESRSEIASPAASLGRHRIKSTVSEDRFPRLDQ